MSEPENTAASARELKVELQREWKLPSGVLGFDASADGTLLFAACMDGGVYVLNGEKGEPRLVGKHASYASSVHLLSGQTLVSGGYDGTLQWHDAKEGKTVRKVTAHSSWSWQVAVSRDGGYVASGGGQYLCGGYRYEPAPEREPSVKVFRGTGELLHGLSHVPPVQSLAISADSRFLAAGNLMGEVRVWELGSGRELARWTTPSFTGWGIIKGHYYTGGIFAMQFAPESEELLVCGMGSTTDPAAGNGRQLWERFAWRDGKKLAEASENDIGRGLMETLAYHPGGKLFVMAGRLFNGKWNTAFFDAAGSLRHALDTKMRTTSALFHSNGNQLFLAGTTDQGKKADGKYPEPGRIRIYSIEGI